MKENWKWKKMIQKEIKKDKRLRQNLGIHQWSQEEIQNRQEKGNYHNFTIRVPLAKLIWRVVVLGENNKHPYQETLLIHRMTEVNMQSWWKSKSIKAKKGRSGILVWKMRTHKVRCLQLELGLQERLKCLLLLNLKRFKLQQCATLIIMEARDLNQAIGGNIVRWSIIRVSMRRGNL